MNSVREMLWKQQHPELNDVLPSKRSSDLEQRAATSSTRETAERRAAMQRDSAPKKLDPWHQGVVDRMKQAPAPVYAGPTSDAYLRHLADEAERERQASPEYQQRKREEEQRAAREKAEQELRRKRGTFEWNERQRSAALEGLNPDEQFAVMNDPRLPDINDFDSIKLLAQEKIFNRPEHEMQREVERIMVEEDVGYADAQRVYEGARYYKMDTHKYFKEVTAKNVKAFQPTTGYEKGKQKQ